MAKTTHEIRDAVHGFITCSTEEREIINSRPIQRLRHIHHLAMTYLVYPGATHRRFEHSLGVMELATRIFNILTHKENVSHLRGEVREAIEEQIVEPRKLEHWRTVVRMGALCHDVGHLPFSHGAEALLPEGRTHEWLTWKIICGPHMMDHWRKLNIAYPAEVAKVALGQQATSSMGIPLEFSTWDQLMSEIVVGNAFGADRMDYLLRDSLHTGVAYGRFDIERLIKTLRFLPKAPEGKEDDSDEPEIGVELGGLHAAESLLWARYFMFTQVYFHHVRKAYDIHLQEYMNAFMPEGVVAEDDTELDKFMMTTDNEILASIRKAAYNPALPGHDAARRIEKREHFRKVFELTEKQRKEEPGLLRRLAEAAAVEWGQGQIRIFDKGKGSGALQFPVRLDDERIVSSLAQSPAIEHLPQAKTDFFFVAPEIHSAVRKWMKSKKCPLNQSSTGASP